MRGSVEPIITELEWRAAHDRLDGVGRTTIAVASTQNIVAFPAPKAGYGELDLPAGRQQTGNRGELVCSVGSSDFARNDLNAIRIDNTPA